MKQHKQQKHNSKAERFQTVRELNTGCTGYGCSCANIGKMRDLLATLTAHVPKHTLFLLNIAGKANGCLGRVATYTMYIALGQHDRNKQ